MEQPFYCILLVNSALLYYIQGYIQSSDAASFYSNLALFLFLIDFIDALVNPLCHSVIAQSSFQA